MEPKVQIPTLDEVKAFLDEYGWKYREVSSGMGQLGVLSNYALQDKNKGILLSFRIEGEFVMVSTIGLLFDIDKSQAEKILGLNDSVKLVKIFSLNMPDAEKLEIEVGFELWAESWNKGTFFAFMDMFCLGIEKVMWSVENQNIAHQTKYIEYSEGKA